MSRPDLEALADDHALVAELHHFAAQGVVLAAEPHDLERLGHGELELLRPHGLGDVVHRAGLDRGDGVLDRRVAREHDQGDVVPFLLQQLEELEPRQPGHPVVRDDQVDVSLGERLKRFRHAVRANGRVARPLERVLENEPDRGLIVHVQDGGHVPAWDGTTMGAEARNTVETCRCKVSQRAAATERPDELAAPCARRD
jgi:hypothetical protein